MDTRTPIVAIGDDISRVLDRIFFWTDELRTRQAEADPDDPEDLRRCHEAHCKLVDLGILLAGLRDEARRLRGEG